MVGFAFSLDVVVEAVDEGFPACVDDVEADADGAPLFFAVGAFDEHACFGGAASFAVDDADFVVAEGDVVDFWVGGAEGFAEGLVEGVDGAFAFFDGVDAVVVDDDFDGGFTGFEAAFAVGAVGGVVFEEVEGGGVFAEDFADEEFEGGVCGFVFVALVFALFDGVEDAFDAWGAAHEFEAELVGFVEDVVLAGEVADEDDLVVADGGWGDVFVAASEFLDGVDVGAAFV